jgi:hypothetical protein
MGRLHGSPIHLCQTYARPRGLSFLSLIAQLPLGYAEGKTTPGYGFPKTPGAAT